MHAVWPLFLCHGPRQTVVTGTVIAVGLGGIAVGERAAKERMGLAAHFMLDREQHLARVEIDNVIEAIFVRVDLARQQIELVEPALRAGKIGNVNLHVMAVIWQFGLAGFTEIPVLLLADLNAGGTAAAVPDHRGQRTHHFAVEPRNALGRTGTNVELDIGHAEHDAAKAVFVRRMNVDAIAPRAHGLHAVIALAELEFRSFQRLSHLSETVEQRRAIRDHQAGDPAQDIRLPGRQMKLAHADVDPHVARTGVEERIASEPETTDVIPRRQVLIGDADIHVSEIDDVAEVLAGAVIVLAGHDVLARLPGDNRRNSSAVSMRVASFLAARSGSSAARPNTSYAGVNVGSREDARPNLRDSVDLRALLW